MIGPTFAERSCVMRKFGAALVLMMAGCAAPAAGAPSGAAGASQADAHSALNVVIIAPPTAAYDISTFGPTTRTVSVRLVNEGDHPVDIAGADTVFSVTRDGVSFACPAHPRKHEHKHVPEYLPPGEPFSFERTVDCTMPLPGSYKLRVYITFDEDSANTVADFADEVTFNVLPDNHAPKPYPSRNGLYVVMGGDIVTHPLLPEGWARGDYHVVVAVINATNHSIPVGPARLSFLTYKSRSSLPCSGQAETLSFPSQIAAGTMLTSAASVTCAPSEEGVYEIVGHLALAQAGDTEVEIGRVDLTVTSDPHFFVPGLQLWPNELTQ